MNSESSSTIQYIHVIKLVNVEYVEGHGARLYYSRATPSLSSCLLRSLATTEDRAACSSCPQEDCQGGHQNKNCQKKRSLGSDHSRTDSALSLEILEASSLDSKFVCSSCVFQCNECPFSILFLFCLSHGQPRSKFVWVCAHWQWMTLPRCCKMHCQSWWP